MLTGQIEAAVRLDQHGIGGPAALLAPVRPAAEIVRVQMPGHGEARLEALGVLGEDLLTSGDGEGRPVGGAPGAEPDGVGPEAVHAEDDTLVALPARGRQGDRADVRIVQIDVSAVDAVVLLPEPPLHLQAHLVDRRVGHLGHGRAEGPGDVQVQGSQHR